MSTLTEDEIEQIEEAKAEAEARTKEAIAVERAQRRMILDEANAVQAWVPCWAWLDLREFETKEEVPWPPYPFIRLEPRTAELDNYIDDDNEMGGRNFTHPGDEWIGHHRIDPRFPSRHVAIEALPDLPDRVDIHELYVRIALYGEVERFTLPGQPAQSVVRHGLGHTRTEETPDRPMWRGTQAQVTGVAGHRDADDNSVYLHYTHWWHKDGRKYPNTERVMYRDFLASEVATLWDVPVIGSTDTELVTT